MLINIIKLANEIHAGDWHDKPLRWQVQGPASEIQNFSTKKDAEKYARIRKKSSDWVSASKKWVESFKY